MFQLFQLKKQNFCWMIRVYSKVLWYIIGKHYMIYICKKVAYRNYITIHSSTRNHIVRYLMNIFIQNMIFCINILSKFLKNGLLSESMNNIIYLKYIYFVTFTICKCINNFKYINLCKFRLIITSTVCICLKKMRQFVIVQNSVFF